MVQLAYGAYYDDDGRLYALLVLPDTLVVQGFVTPPVGTPRRADELAPRREWFANSNGTLTGRPYPSVTAPHRLGEVVTLRGDPSYVKVSQTSEKKEDST